MGEFVLISKEDISKWRSKLSTLLDKMDVASETSQQIREYLLELFETLEG